MKAIAGTLRQQVLALAAGMRRFGVPVAPTEEILAFRALLSVDFGDPEDVRLALRTALCRSREAQDVFDQLYPRWLRGGTLEPDETEPSAPTDSGVAGAAQHSAPQTRKPSPSQRQGAEQQEAERSRYSPAPATTGTQAALVARDARRLALREADVFLAALRLGVGRRYRAGAGRRIDMRRSLHGALASQGEVLRLYHRRRRPRPPRVLLLCDGSRSMMTEAAGVLRLGHALLRRSRRAEVFLFSTALRRVSRQLRNAGGAQPTLTQLGEGYGGGTRIGAALRTLLTRHGRLLSRDCVVLIASDGLDTGDTLLLAQTMSQIRARCAYVFWLNPLAGTQGFAPLQRGMQAALPYIDLLWDMHDPHALSRLARRVREGRIPA